MVVISFGFDRNNCFEIPVSLKEDCRFIMFVKSRRWIREWSSNSRSSPRAGHNTDEAFLYEG